MKKILIVILFISMAGCGIKKLEQENEVLKNELELTRQANQTLYEIGVLLDSIDQSRENLRLNLEEGTTYDEYVERVKGLNEYVKNTEKKLEELEVSIKKSSQSNTALNATVKKLRKELEEKNKYITFLEDQVTKYEVQKDSLVTMTEIQEEELDEKESLIERKNEELALIEARIIELMKQAQVNEADAYFARAAAVEEAANRTKLAPKKKKETYREAIDLYKKAKELGRDDAQAKIDELNEKI